MAPSAGAMEIKMSNEKNTEIKSDQPLAEIQHSRADDGPVKTTPADGQAAIVADPRNRIDEQKTNDEKRPEDLDATNDD